MSELPSDALANLERYREDNGEFGEHERSLPEASLPQPEVPESSFRQRQAIGRLVRDATDSGLLVQVRSEMGDPRQWSAVTPIGVDGDGNKRSLTVSVHQDYELAGGDFYVTTEVATEQPSPPLLARVFGAKKPDPVRGTLFDITQESSQLDEPEFTQLMADLHSLSGNSGTSRFKPNPQHLERVLGFLASK